MIGKELKFIRRAILYNSKGNVNVVKEVSVIESE